MARGRIAANLFAAMLTLWPVAALGEDLHCLWNGLVTADKARLELGALTGSKALKTLYDRQGPEGFARSLGACGLPLEPPTLIRVGHYLDARAGAEVIGVQLQRAGFAPDRLETALLRHAPSARRKAMAREILAFDPSRRAPSAARDAIRAFAKELGRKGKTKAQTQKTEQLASRWATHRILADGLEAGAGRR